MKRSGEVMVGCAAAAAIVVAGCGTTATVRLNDGRVFEGQLRQSANGSVRVGQQEVTITDIDDIDHPGNVHVLSGGLVTAYGVANIAVGLPRCKDEGGAFCTGVFIPAVVGVSMFTWGLYTWEKSRGEASEYHESRSRQRRVGFTPYVVPTHAGTNAGVSFAADF